MQKILIVVFVSILASGCANERIIARSHEYYQDINKLAIQEVIDNIDATIDDPQRIPTRTTFGKGNLTFTDNAQAAITLPFAMTPTSRGTFGANIGSFIDSYQIAINPETDAETLAKLRDIYRTLVYPLSFEARTRIPGFGRRWIFWTNGAPEDAPPIEATMVGQGRNHDIYVTDRDSFSKFVLLTYGYLTSSNPRISENLQINREGGGRGRAANGMEVTKLNGRSSGSGGSAKRSAGISGGTGIPARRELPTLVPSSPAKRSAGSEGVPGQRVRPSFVPAERDKPSDNPNALPVPTIR